MFRPLLEHFFTPICRACGWLGEYVCADCARNLQPVIRRLKTLTVYSATPYAGWARECLISAKNGNRSEVNPLSELTSQAIVTLCSNEHLASIELIPIPMTQQKRRARGFAIVEEIAQHQSRQARVQQDKRSRSLAGPRITTHPEALCVRRTVDDQVGLNHRERQHNVTGVFKATRQLTGVWVLIDDVVTSGATLESAAAAIRQAGGTVDFAVTTCATAKSG